MKDDTKITRKQAVFRRNISLIVGLGMLISAFLVYIGTPFIETQLSIEGDIIRFKTAGISLILLALVGLGLVVTFITVMFWFEWKHENKELVKRK